MRNSQVRLNCVVLGENARSYLLYVWILISYFSATKEVSNHTSVHTNFYVLFIFTTYYRHRIRLKVNNKWQWKKKRGKKMNEKNPVRIREKKNGICQKRIIRDLYIHYWNYIIVCQFVRNFVFFFTFALAHFLTYSCDVCCSDQRPNSIEQKMNYK